MRLHLLKKGVGSGSAVGEDPPKKKRNLGRQPTVDPAIFDDVKKKVVAGTLKAEDIKAFQKKTEDKV